MILDLLAAGGEECERITCRSKKRRRLFAAVQRRLPDANIGFANSTRGQRPINGLRHSPAVGIRRKSSFAADRAFKSKLTRI